jgi:methylaspartate ammonia-lyase
MLIKMECCNEYKDIKTFAVCDTCLQVIIKCPLCNNIWKANKACDCITFQFNCPESRIEPCTTSEKSVKKELEKHAFPLSPPKLFRQ